MQKEFDKIDGQNYIYHRFTFDAAIQDHTFIGDEFIGMNPGDESETMEIFDRVVAAGKEGFMPNLVEEIKKSWVKEITFTMVMKSARKISGCTFLLKQNFMILF